MEEAATHEGGYKDYRQNTANWHNQFCKYRFVVSNAANSLDRNINWTVLLISPSVEVLITGGRHARDINSLQAR